MELLGECIIRFKRHFIILCESGFERAALMNLIKEWVFDQILSGSVIEFEEPVANSIDELQNSLM